jgi:RNA polymerase sigma-70 factor (ECF subfamily)
MVTRMSIDLLRSARKQRETYVGEWLPEPLATEEVSAPENIALAESLSTAFLLMLERLSPVERAAFLLREVFDYDYPEVADVIGKSEDNCRQIVRRAKERVQAPALRFEAREDARDALLNTFMSAVRDGELQVLVSLLAGDAALYSDHGGKASAARRTIRGADKIARFFIGVDTRFRPPHFSYRFTWLNGAPGIIVYSGTRAETAFSVEIEDGKIQAFYVTRNPDKLAHLPGPVGTASPGD